MAAQHSPRSNQQRERAEHADAAAPPVVASPPPRRKSVALQDPEDMVLLREKLNQIAVGMRHTGDNQVEHMEDSGAEDDHESCGSNRRRRPHGHFRVFLGHGNRPSTPPSSPQPRDVLRKQLRLKNQSMFTHQRSIGSEDNNSDTASDEPLDGMCVDHVEITACADDDDNNLVHPHPMVQLSVPEHLRVMSSFSVLNKCPEGFRKRKSVHINDLCPEIDDDNVTPLKKVSSQVNVLGSGASPAWESCNIYAGGSCKDCVDEDMEDASPDPTESPVDELPSCS